jgi:hypothetical protein
MFIFLVVIVPSYSAACSAKGRVAEGLIVKSRTMEISNLAQIFRILRGSRVRKMALSRSHSNLYRRNLSARPFNKGLTEGPWSLLYPPMFESAYSSAGDGS